MFYENVLKRTLGMEFLGMTGKFHTSWGEFGGLILSPSHVLEPEVPMENIITFIKTAQKICVR